MNDAKTKEVLNEALVQMQAIRTVFYRILDDTPVPPMAERDSCDTVARILRLRQPLALAFPSQPRAPWN